MIPCVYDYLNRRLRGPAVVLHFYPPPLRAAPGVRAYAPLATPPDSEIGALCAEIAGGWSSVN